MIAAESNCKPIADGVLPIDTWSPINGVQEFEYIDISSVDRVSKRIANTTKVSAKDAPSRAKQIVRTGDVLVSTVRPNLNAVALVPPTLDQAIASTGYTVLRCHPKRLDNRYLFYWVQSPAFVDSMVRQATGASYPAVSDRIVKSSDIPVPSLSEQRRIADILDKADAIRRKRREALDSLDGLCASLFVSFFANELHTGARNQLKEHLIELRYGTSNKSSVVGKPTLRIPNVVRGIVDLRDLKCVPVSDTDFERLALKSDDILFVRTNGNPDYVGRCAVFDEDAIRDAGHDPTKFIYASYLIRGRLNRESLNPHFLQYFLQTTGGRRALRDRCRTSAGQYNINTVGIGSIEIPAVSIERQEQFASHLLSIERVRAKLYAAADATNALFNGLVNRAFKGEL